MALQDLPHQRLRAFWRAGIFKLSREETHNHQNALSNLMGNRNQFPEQHVVVAALHGKLHHQLRNHCRRIMGGKGLVGQSQPQYHREEVHHSRQGNPMRSRDFTPTPRSFALLVRGQGRLAQLEQRRPLQRMPARSGVVGQSRFDQHRITLRSHGFMDMGHHRSHQMRQGDGGGRRLHTKRARPTRWRRRQEGGQWGITWSWRKTS